MKMLRRLFMALTALVFLAMPLPAVSQPQIIFVVCWKYVADKNCNKCSKYFSVRSEEEAQRRCKKMGFAEPNYFPSTQHVFRWMLSHCTCDEDEDDD